MISQGVIGARVTAMDVKSAWNFSENLLMVLYSNNSDYEFVRNIEMVLKLKRKIT